MIFHTSVHWLLQVDRASANHGTDMASRALFFFLQSVGFYQLVANLAQHGDVCKSCALQQGMPVHSSQLSAYVLWNSSRKEPGNTDPPPPTGGIKIEKREAHLVEELCGFAEFSVAQKGSQQLEQVHQQLGIHVPALHTMRLSKMNITVYQPTDREH